jgi:hypothetical protein
VGRLKRSILEIGYSLVERERERDRERQRERERNQRINARDLLGGWIQYRKFKGKRAET